VDRSGPVAVDQEEMEQRHEASTAETRIGVLIADGEDGASTSIVDRGEDYVRQPLTIRTADRKLQYLRPGRMRTQADLWIMVEAVVRRPAGKPASEQLRRHLGLDQVLHLRRSEAHGLGGGGQARAGQ
jgi:hypothetical protein